MIVEDIIDIEKKNSLIYYREEFQAVAVYNILGTEEKGKIQFLIEVDPIGRRQLFLQLIDKTKPTIEETFSAFLQQSALFSLFISSGTRNGLHYSMLYPLPWQHCAMGLQPHGTEC